MKRILCILLAMLLVGCNQPTIPQETPQEIPQESEQPVEEVVVPEESVEEPTEEAVEPLKGEWSEELTALMEIVNEEHRAVKPPEENPDYFGSDVPSNMTVADIHSATTADVFDPAVELTAEQVEEDIEYLFEFLGFMYPLYKEMGGSVVFDEAKEAVLHDCKVADQLDGAMLEQSLLKHLSFIEDGHFWINYKANNERQYPFFFREMAFNKTKNGYESQEGKVVVSVDGYDNLDDLFRRSLSVEGEIVYYPILLKSFVQKDVKETAISFECEETLKIHFDDGSSCVLIAEPFDLYVDTEIENLTMSEKNGIPILENNNFNDNESRKLKEMISKMVDKSASIFDIRSNGGGSTKIVHEMMKYYSGQDVSGDIIEYTMQGDSGLYGDTTAYNAENNFYHNDKLLVILSGKYSSSAAENFVNLASNMENVLIVGENTAGSLISSGGRIQLPNSHMRIGIGVAVAHLLPEDYFEELRGICPDIWIPAEEAEEAALNFIKKHVK